MCVCVHKFDVCACVCVLGAFVAEVVLFCWHSAVSVAQLFKHQELPTSCTLRVCLCIFGLLVTLLC